MAVAFLIAKVLDENFRIAGSGALGEDMELFFGEPPDKMSQPCPFDQGAGLMTYPQGYSGLFNRRLFVSSPVARKSRQKFWCNNGGVKGSLTGLQCQLGTDHPQFPIAPGKQVV